MQIQFNIKLLLFIAGIIITLLIFSINRVMIGQLRNEARTKVEFLAKSYSDAINSSNQEDIRFVIDVLLPSMNFPILITSNNEVSAGLNLGINAEEGSDEYNMLALKMINKMNKDFKPLDLVWGEVKWGKIHYSDPKVIKKLQWMPYFEIGFCILLVSFIVWCFQIIRKGEKNRIYAGMARETAHQLGTPVSSILGWIKLLQEQNKFDMKILNSLKEDVDRLSEVSERFSKIGSKPKFAIFYFYNLIEEVSGYMTNRLPQYSKIKITVSGDKESKIKGDWTLLSWAIENLIKNAIDAIGIGPGEITLNFYISDNKMMLDIIDSGKGINTKDWKNIFRPGFSSKPRGWGLGLSLTERIIKEIHSGGIKVVSSQKGKTIIKSILPL